MLALWSSVNTRDGSFAIFGFLNKVVRKIADSLAWLLNDLSVYPGLHFLKGPAESLESYIERFDAAMEQKERLQQQVATTKSRAMEMREVGEVGHKHKDEGENPHDEPHHEDPASPPGKIASGPPGKPAQGPSASPQPGKGSQSGKGGQAGKGSDVHGTLMLDAFMQSANVPEDLREQWLHAAEAQPAKAAAGGQPGFSGTLVTGGRTMAPGAAPSGAREARGAAVAEPARAESRAMPPAYPQADTPASPYEPRDEVPAARWSEPARVEPTRVEPTAGGYSDYVPPTRKSTPMQPMPAEQSLEEERAADWSTVSTIASTIEEDQPAIIPLGERQQQLARLEYVCQRLRQLRQPLCPANGALAVLPMQTILAGSREMVELQKAARADLATIQNQLKLRFPVTALATGMEDDPGFEEMVRRVGPERARSQRFGHRFDVRSVPTAEQLSALSVRISGVFEDWVYAIYRERGAIARRGNSHLFGLLCKVRTQLQERLMRVLCGGFGHDPERRTHEEPIAFSGCYFAATGRSEDRRAFVAGVFDKLNEEQDNVEWTREARREDRRFRRAGWIALALTAVCGIAMLVEYVLRRL
jgi:hypothetical protein